jgi:hypothetical protein
MKAKIQINARTKNDLLAAVLSTFLDIDDNLEDSGMTLYSDLNSYDKGESKTCHTIEIEDE